MVVDGRVLAMLSGNSYGTEGPVFVADDAGRNWIDVSAPEGTCDIASNGQKWFALTSRGEIWTKPARQGTWSLLKRLRTTALARPDYLYGVLAPRDGRFWVVTPAEIALFDRSAALSEQFSAPKVPSLSSLGELYVGAWFAGDDEQDLIVEANPFAVYVLNRSKRSFIRWTDGMNESRPDGLHGPCRVVRHGEGFLTRTFDSVYAADGLLKPWRALWKPRVGDDELGFAHCRALCTFDSSKDQWLRADVSGVHLTQGTEKLRTVFLDKPDDHDLIIDIIQFHGRYFVSFARLKEGTLGVVLSGDLTQWETVSVGHATKRD